MTKHLIVIKHIFKNICYLGFLGVVSISCKNQDTLFTLKTPEETGIQFANHNDDPANGPAFGNVSLAGGAQ